MVALGQVWHLGTEAARQVAWAEKEAEPLLMRLAPADRAKVLMSLLGLLLVGLALVMLAVLVGRYVMREARRSHGPTPLYEDRWSRKPLVPRDSSSDRESQ